MLLLREKHRWLSSFVVSVSCEVNASSKIHRDDRKVLHKRTIYRGAGRVKSTLNGALLHSKGWGTGELETQGQIEPERSLARAGSFSGESQIGYVCMWEGDKGWGINILTQSYSLLLTWPSCLHWMKTNGSQTSGKAIDKPHKGQAPGANGKHSTRLFLKQTKQNFSVWSKS